MNTINFMSKKSSHHYKHINYDFDIDDGIMWVYLDSYPRPCVSPQLINDIRALHRLIEVNKGQFPIAGSLEKVNYHVLDSHAHGVFSLGGDLSLFLDCIKNKDKFTLMEYATSCIAAIYPIIDDFGLPITTISLVRGNALGGGFEIALSGDVIIAERSSQMGFPEILFNCFPGMGGFQLLANKIGLNKAKKIIENGKLHSAEELYELGVVDVLADDGCGEAAVYSYIQNRNKHWNGHQAIQKVAHRLKHIEREELMDICRDIWVDTVFSMTDKDIRTVSRLLHSQQRYMSEGNYLQYKHLTAS